MFVKTRKPVPVRTFLLLLGVVVNAVNLWATQVTPTSTTGLLPRNLDPPVEALRLTNVRKITASAGYHSARWSPDGKVLSFVDDHATYTARASSYAIRQISSLPAGFAYFWTKDGGSLIYRETDPTTFRIQRLSIDTGKVQQLATGEDLILPSEPQPGLIQYRRPTGATHNKTHSQTGLETIGTFAWHADDQIFVSHAGTIRQVTATGSGRYFLPSASPDGEQLLYYELSRGLFITTLSTGHTRSFGILSDASWSPVGNQVICVRITYPADEEFAEPRSSQLTIIADDGRFRFLTEIPDVKPRRPALSPDGRTIAFDADGAIFLAEIKE